MIMNSCACWIFMGWLDTYSSLNRTANMKSLLVSHPTQVEVWILLLLFFCSVG